MARQRLDQDDEILAAAAHAAIGGIVGQRHVTGFSQRLESRMRELARGIEPAHLLCRQHARQQFGDVAPDQLLFVGQPEIIQVSHQTLEITIQLQSNTTTPRATSPAIILLKPSLISESL